MMRARLHVLVASLALLTAAGCVKTIGKTADRYPVANSPEGVTTTVSFHNGTPVTGELLEVRDTVLVLRRGKDVVLARTAAISSVSLEGGDPRVRSMTPDEFTRRDLRLLSRYPSGITPVVMAALLSASGQSEPTIVPR
jgi:hypothetical protein